MIDTNMQETAATNVNTSGIDIAAIFARTQDNAGIGELAKTLADMEKKPTTLRGLNELVAKMKKEHTDICFDEAAVGRVNGFNVSPAWLYVETGFNLRNLDVDHVAMFKNMWANAARIPAILVKAVIVDGVTRLKVIDGHHRVAGLMAAIDEGANILSVAVEEYVGNSAGEVFEMLKSAQGLALKPIERAEGFRRLRGWNLSIEDIAKGSGNNIQTVRRSLVLADAEEPVKELVRDDKVAADVAIDLIIECRGTERDVFGELQKSLKNAERAGKSKVTARFVNSTKTTIKPKVVRETFTSLLPASNQIRAQIERVKTDEVADPETVNLTVPPDAARLLLSVLEQYEASNKAAADADAAAAAADTVVDEPSVAGGADDATDDEGDNDAVQD